MSVNRGFAADARGSPATSSLKVWYGPHITFWASKTEATLLRLRTAIHACSNSQISCRPRHRSPSLLKYSPSRASRLRNSPLNPVASTRLRHCRRENGGRREKACHCVPSRKHVVHRAVAAFGSGNERKPESGVDGVVHRRAA